MIDTAQAWLITNWGFLAAGATSFSIGIAVLGRIVKGVGSILGAKADKNAEESRTETAKSIQEIKEDVNELKEKAKLDALINSQNPILTEQERLAYAKMAETSMLEKIEDGLELFETVVDIGAAVTKTWQDL